ncbi:MAG: hybrid sensor histidine kinase/response regulator [Gammaproteobacteria bacterium]
MLAHELRNPLAPIQNALQVMRLTGGNGDAVRSAFEMMERQVGQMVRLVDDLLDVSRISRGKIELRRERVELASVVHHAVEACRPALESAKHDLTLTLPPQPVYLHGDPVRLAQVIGNLLNNACKFTDTGGLIWLTVEREPPRSPRGAPPHSPPSQGGVGGVPGAGGFAVIRVRDTGIGIPADELPRVFEIFKQVDTSLERSVSGLGIGLTLVKTLVEMHGGMVEVHSAGVGQGSEFVVRLPIMVGTPEPPPEPIASEPTTTIARRILVVDDNPDSAESLAMLLQISGN